MTEAIRRSDDTDIVRIEPDDRIVALARIIEATVPEANAALVDSVNDGARFGETCIGQALYRHRSVFQSD